MAQQRVIPVAPMSRRKIEVAAHQFLVQRLPGVIDAETRIPVAEWLEFDMPSEIGVPFLVDDLGPAVEAVTMPMEDGTWAVTMDTSVYERLQRGDGRAMFTAAHEVGHVVLHINQVKQQLVNGSAGLRRESRDILPYRNPEWQAHAFASAVLAPAFTVKRLCAGEPASRWPSILRNVFGISGRAAEVRVSVLRDLGILRDAG